jgi:hypothetical protein
MVFGKTRGPEEDTVLGALGAYRFQIMGFTRSHHDFYVGEGWYLSLALFVVIVLTWQLAGLAVAQPAVVRRLVVLPLLFAVGSAVLCGLYFFIAPLVMSALAAVSVGVAWQRLGRG